MQMYANLSFFSNFAGEKYVKIVEMERLTLIKVGGKIVEEAETLHRLLNDFAAINGYKVLVHGGGRSATKLASRLGIESQMVNGRRITDASMLEIVTMVYGGLVNKNIVAGLQALGVNALGLTGADMNLMRSEKRPVKDVDYGFVGDVKEVNADLLASLIHQGVVPCLPGGCGGSEFIIALGKQTVKLGYLSRKLLRLNAAGGLIPGFLSLFSRARRNE